MTGLVVGAQVVSCLANFADNYVGLLRYLSFSSRFIINEEATYILAPDFKEDNEVNKYLSSIKRG